MNALDRSLYCQSRPPAVIAVALLLLNDHLLKATFPGWWTGSRLLRQRRVGNRIWRPLLTTLFGEEQPVFAWLSGYFSE